MWDRDQMAARAAQELQDGWYVNLGIGIPTMVSNHIPEGVNVTLQSENGMLGMGPFPTEDEIDPDLINAGKQTITELPQTAYFDSAESFAMIRGGKIAMAMMALPRYRHQTIADLQHMVLEPLIRDRVAIAYPGDKDRSELTDISGVAIWASVSEEVDAKIREQIKAGVFPVRLQSDDWASGEINWLLDVIAPDQKMTASVIANFKQVVKDGDLRLHPLIARLVDKETLEKMGAAPILREE